ncbi:hypothetical protein [Kitasatospora sp. NPDC059827]|uniref:hypothetical protein n=1 Tax=Kitasatospora sp. NPDC059827 TaxID=3346964 RepID=UPI003667AEC1
MVRVTPPRPVDIAAAFPELAPLARQAVRLHPRPGAPGAHDSSVGGPLLWPAGEPWPVCARPHPEEHDGGIAVSVADVRLRRALYETTGRTAEQDAALEATFAGHPWSGRPNAMLPVAQLYARDVPLLPCPEDADVMQVLWCPLEHDPQWAPAPKVLWRSSALVGELLTELPLPAEVAEHGGYLPEPCVLHPEVVTEYPAPLELEDGLAERIEDWCEDWCERELTGTDPLYRNAEEYRAYYQFELAVAPGWKVGGWAPCASMDPYTAYCEECRAVMRPLLTIDPDVVGGGSWAPVEDRRLDFDLGIAIGRSNVLQLYRCPVSLEHPCVEVVQ